MGGVFLRRTVRAKAEVINDLGRDVSNLFRIAQRHPDALAGVLRLQLSSRDDFERLERTDPETLTDVERAARFVVLQRLAFGSKLAGRHFRVSANAHLQGSFRSGPVIDAIHALHRRLEGVVVERLPWEAFVRRYDTPDTLFYLDPAVLWERGRLRARAVRPLAVRADGAGAGRAPRALHPQPERSAAGAGDLRAVQGRQRGHPLRDQRQGRDAGAGGDHHRLTWLRYIGAPGEVTQHPPLERPRPDRPGALFCV